jgi:hypothetical protein
MELNAIKLRVQVGDGGKARVLRMGQAHEIRRHLVRRIPMAHPDRNLRVQPAEDSVSMIDFDFGMAILPMLGFFHAAAEVLGHELHPIADPEDREPQAPNPGVRPRGVGRIDA